MNSLNQNSVPPHPQVEEIKILYRVGFKIAGKWAWQDLELPSAGLSLPQNVRAMPPLGIPQNQTPQPIMKRNAPPMTMGRDPGQFLMTFGKFKGEKLENLDVFELNDWVEWANEQKDATPTLEVAREQVEAYLIDREFVPSQKRNKRA